MTNEELVSILKRNRPERPRSTNNRIFQKAIDEVCEKLERGSENETFDYHPRL